MESTESHRLENKVSYLFNSKLPIARYRFTAIVRQPLSLPDYAGSLLRGQFGAALRNVACMTRQPTCPGCPLLQSCPYSRIFESPPPPKGQHTLQDFSQIPNPFVIEPPISGARLIGAGEVLEFQLVLVGHAIDHLALIVFALQRALAQGLTRQRAPAQLQRVDMLDAQGTAQTIWTRELPTLAEHSTQLAVPAAPRGLRSITLVIQTPMRLQQQGQPLRVAQLTPRALVAAVARRTALLMEFHAGQTGLGEVARCVTQLSEDLTDTKELHWFDWVRYSSRQNQEMTLGGVLGRWTLNGPDSLLASIWPWLWLGKWLHTGKNATMGMGGYDLATTPQK